LNFLLHVFSSCVKICDNLQISATGKIKKNLGGSFAAILVKNKQHRSGTITSLFLYRKRSPMQIFVIVEKPFRSGALLLYVNLRLLCGAVSLPFVCS